MKEKNTMFYRTVRLLQVKRMLVMEGFTISGSGNELRSEKERMITHNDAYAIPSPFQKSTQGI